MRVVSKKKNFPQLKHLIDGQHAGLVYTCNIQGSEKAIDLPRRFLKKNMIYFEEINMILSLTLCSYHVIFFSNQYSVRRKYL